MNENIKFFLKHYKDFEDLIDKKLEEFRVYKTDKELFSEMIFCVFAANSSAKMGLKAQNLLEDIKDYSFENILNKVLGKVRFYNVRSKYLAFNKKRFDEIANFSHVLANKDFYSRREFIKNNFKGFGMKESSHYLRNIGYKNYAIVDKHVLYLLKSFEVIDSELPPKNKAEYELVEKKIWLFAKKYGLCVDKLDLALWSFKTGEIIK